jgi:hypothetical protein
MVNHAREPLFRGDAVDASEQGLDRFYGNDPVFSDDPLLTIAYAISELAIAFLGPTFWMLCRLALPGRRVKAIG